MDPGSSTSSPSSMCWFYRLCPPCGGHRPILLCPWIQPPWVQPRALTGPWVQPPAMFCPWAQLPAMFCPWGQLPAMLCPWVQLPAMLCAEAGTAVAATHAPKTRVASDSSIPLLDKMAILYLLFILAQPRLSGCRQLLPPDNGRAGPELLRARILPL